MRDPAGHPPHPGRDARPPRCAAGFGQQKARIFAALLGKQLGVRPAGWREAIGPYAEDGSFRSVADVVDQQSLDQVRAFKKSQKAAARTSSGP